MHVDGALVVVVGVDGEQVAEHIKGALMPMTTVSSWPRSPRASSRARAITHVPLMLLMSKDEDAGWMSILGAGKQRMDANGEVMRRDP